MESKMNPSVLFQKEKKAISHQTSMNCPPKRSMTSSKKSRGVNGIVKLADSFSGNKPITIFKTSNWQKKPKPTNT